jgi:hypothetical protein
MSPNDSDGGLDPLRLSKNQRRAELLKQIYQLSTIPGFLRRSLLRMPMFLWDTSPGSLFANNQILSSIRGKYILPPAFSFGLFG